MSGPESLIIAAVGTLLLSSNAAKFLIKEAIAVVLLCKELKAAIKSEYPLGQSKRPHPELPARKHDLLSHGMSKHRKGPPLQLALPPMDGAGNSSQDE